MKKHIFSLLAIASLALSACGGGSSEQQQEDNLLKEFTFVEPNEPIAEKICELLSEDDSDFGGEEDMDIDTSSNTYKAFAFNLWSKYDDISINHHIEIKCYQMLDSSWIGVVYKSIDESMEGTTRQEEKVFAVRYSDNKITPVDSASIFPELFFHVVNINRHCTRKVVWNFKNTTIEPTSEYFWPLRFVWNGTNFFADTSFQFIQNVDPSKGGHFWYYSADSKPVDIWINSEPDKEYGISNGGILKDKKGNPLAKFEVEDGKVMGYYLLDPNLGFGRAYDFAIKGEPAAIGKPIKNVLDEYQDTTVTKTMKDGKLVVTHHIKHSDYSLIDVFREYTANDENSSIESIHVYAVPFTVSVEEQLDKSNNISPKTRALFTSFDFSNKISGLGKFKGLDGNDDHILLQYENGNYLFQVYSDQLEVDYMLVIKKIDDSYDPISAKWWYRNEEGLHPILINIPPFPHNDKSYTLYFDDEGLHYDNYETKDFRFYKWDSGDFINEYDDDYSISPNGERKFNKFATGDLNNDGCKDSVAFANFFEVYWGSSDNKYTLFKKYKLYNPDIERATYNRSADISLDGKLVVLTQFECDGYQNYTYTLSFQDGEFQLEKIIYSSGLDYGSERELDFVNLTAEVSGDTDEDIFHYKYSLKKLPLLKLPDFTIGSGPEGSVLDKYLDEKTRKSVK